MQASGEKKPRLDCQEEGDYEGASLKFDGSFAKKYIRTKEGNLRCWPHCDVEHMEKSFCGSTLELVVKSGVDCSNATLFGEFRTTSRMPSFKVGDRVSEQVNQMSDKFMTGRLERRLGRQWFVIAPSRKWKCREEKRLNSTSRFHTFTVYLCFDNQVCEILDSQAFQVVTSKAKLEPAKRDPAMLAKLQAISQAGGAPVVLPPVESDGTAKNNHQQAANSILEGPSRPGSILPKLTPLQTMQRFPQTGWNAAPLSGTPMCSPAQHYPSQSLSARFDLLSQCSLYLPLYQQPFAVDCDPRANE